MDCNNKKPLVGIVSLFGYINYGNALQRRAVCEAISLNNCHPIVIDPRRINRATIRMLIKEEAFRRGLPLISHNLRLSRFINFDTGLDIQAARANSMLEKIGHTLDAVVIGSDQVWNPEMEFDPYTSFLEFVEPEKRIALAPSFGISEINDKLKNVYRTGLSGFPQLSVREENGAKLIKQMAGKDAVVLCDPTLAFDSSYWGAVASNRMVPNYPYALKYVLGKSTNVGENVCSSTNELQCSLIELNNPFSLYFNAGPADFLGLIRNAKLVITDSFHATAFSIIFHTPVKVVERLDSMSSMKSRIDTLEQTFKVRFSGDSDDFNWSEIDLIRSNKAASFKDYLTTELQRAFGGVNCGKRQ